MTKHRNPAPAKLKLLSLGPSFYLVDGEAIHVRKEERQSWNARLGSHRVVQWLAYGARAPYPLVARATHFSDLKTRLLRYLSDRDTHNLGTRQRYGISGDTRPVDRVDAPTPGAY
jgi:hypothetical protein